MNLQVEHLRLLPFEPGSDIVKYFELLPDGSAVKKSYEAMTALPGGEQKKAAQQNLRTMIRAGSIYVNIMAKVDGLHYNKNEEPLPPEYANAMSSFRGYAKSDLNSTIVFSAGYNPRLYDYVENFEDFFPDQNGFVKKKIAIKVSDYRSALIQGKVFAKKGIFVSEFRIESGLNCGGHAFATDGLLLGPILEEFKVNREMLEKELFAMSDAVLKQKGKPGFHAPPRLKLTVQGGVGTHHEHEFLLSHYGFNSVGWGSPFLLVPEVTNVDEETLCKLSCAQKEDYYLSNNSPLGIPFNNFRQTSAEAMMKKREEKGRPGSPCYKKYLATNTEFTDRPICTASREYQHNKIAQLRQRNLPAAEFEKEYQRIIEKECLCEGLGAAALQKNGIEHPHRLTAVTICPGPNLAYFSGIHSLKEMTDHIYGRTSLLNSLKRSNMFVNEIALYADYLKGKISANAIVSAANFEKDFRTYQDNMLQGIKYYRTLITGKCLNESDAYAQEMLEELNDLEQMIAGLAPLPALNGQQKMAAASGSSVLTGNGR